REQILGLKSRSPDSNRNGSGKRTRRCLHSSLRANVAISGLKTGFKSFRIPAKNTNAGILFRRKENLVAGEGFERNSRFGGRRCLLPWVCLRWSARAPRPSSNPYGVARSRNAETCTRR